MRRVAAGQLAAVCALSEHSNLEVALILSAAVYDVASEVVI